MIEEVWSSRREYLLGKAERAQGQKRTGVYKSDLPLIDAELRGMGAFSNSDYSKRIEQSGAINGTD